jgi:hypothetical protein
VKCPKCKKQVVPQVTDTSVCLGKANTVCPLCGKRFNEHCCFVATCVFEGHDAPEVITLSSFRDNYLLKRPMGRAFVWTYERTGPTLAGLVDTVPATKPPLRRLLRLVARTLPTAS